MKLLSLLKLTKAEQKLLKKTFSYSIAGCIIIIIAALAIRFFQTNKRSFSSIQNQSVESLFSQNADKLNPIDIEAHEVCANYYLKLNQPANALPHLQRILTFKKGDRFFMLNLATTYIEAALYKEAALILERLTEEPKEDTLTARIKASYGLVLFYTNQQQQSIKVLRNCLKRYPSSAEAACFLGQVYASFSLPSDSAEYYFGLSLTLDSNFNEALYQWARYLMNVGNYPKARLYLAKLLEKEPLHIKAHSRMGMVYYYLNQPELAKKSYETALALNPHDYNTRYNLGELYYSFYNDKINALAEFKAALTENPDHIEANFKTGLICLHNNMVKEAVRYFEKARSLDPKNIRILLQLAVAYEKLELKEEALEVYKTIKDIDGLNKIALQKIAILSQ